VRQRVRAVQRQRVLPLGYHHQMDVVGHEAATEDPSAVPPGLPPQEFQLETVVVGGIEHRLPMVPPLCNVVSHAGNDYASAARHIAEQCHAPPRDLI
jgi:hypothetical protein